MRKETCIITDDNTLPFTNNTGVCIGTGRIGLALRAEYREQLAMIQEQIGFRWIRGHGLFNEDMAIYQEYKTESGEVVPEYNFTYVDLVMDSYLKLGIRPFLELGFMPWALASADQSVFYWKGNVTPPKDYDRWNGLVKATLTHLIERYGAAEVTAWPVEVWNEPNLKHFWSGDRQAYFRMFRETIGTVKSVDARFRVGGPAICGVDDVSWLKDFLNFCRDEKLPLDFVTRHLYDISLPQTDGRYGYPRINPLSRACAETERSRQIIDSYPEFRGMEMHITEFNTSYSPRTPLHDTNLNAAYVAYLLSRLGDDCASYAYWTFGDVFEEQGVPFTPFHGGFGLIANRNIRKPTFWTFKFFKDLGAGICVHRSDEAVVLKKDNGAYRGIAWNIAAGGTEDALALRFTLPANACNGGDYCVVMKTVDETVCNPLKVWHDIGEPANPSREQIALLRDAAWPLVTTQRGTETPVIELTLARNAVVYFEVFPAAIKSDRGFNYDRAVNVTFSDD
jgi:xylan 1,4-beta-xylosidase